MQRSQPLLLLATFVVVIGGVFALGRGSGHASHVDPAAAARTTPGGSPLDEVLTAAQLAQFTRATANLSLVMYADALPARRGNALVTSACGDLDERAPLLGALQRTCSPLLALSAATRATRSACPGGADCAAVLRSRADAFEQVATNDRVFARSVRREVPKGECRTALAPVHDVIAAELALARVSRRMADAIEQRDRPAFAERRRTSRRHAQVIDDQLVWFRTRDMAEACNLEPWAFETAS